MVFVFYGSDNCVPQNLIWSLYTSLQSQSEKVHLVIQLFHFISHEERWIINILQFETPQENFVFLSMCRYPADV